MSEADRYPAGDRAREAILASAGPDLGDELRRQAESLAYLAAKDYESVLQRIENQLVVAANRGGGFSQTVNDVALDVVRTHMVRGLLRAQLEAGNHLAFWVRR